MDSVDLDEGCPDGCGDTLALMDPTDDDSVVCTKCGWRL